MTASGRERLLRGWLRIAAFSALLVLPACFCARFYATPWPSPVESHRVRTSDGWELDLRHVPAMGLTRRPRPVVLLHGIVANGRNMDFDEKHSLARSLAIDGFDVWVPSLRNVGDSEHRSTPSGVTAGYDFEAYVHRDLPAILEAVRASTGAPEVDFVGHSMGGMILYAHLASGGTGVRRAVTIASPVQIRWTGRLESTVRTLSPAAGFAALFPLAGSAHAFLPFQASFNGPIERLLMSPANVDSALWRRFLAVGIDDVPAPLLQQFAGWLARDRFDDADGRDYLEALSTVRVPIYVMAGKVDGMAPPWSVRPAFDRLASTEKRWFVAGEANGLVADYNHMDFLLGERASKEIFPRIAGWLARE